MGKNDKFQRKPVLQLDGSRRGLGYKQESGASASYASPYVSSDDESTEGHSKKLIAFQKSSEVVGGSNPVRANDAKSSSKKNTKGSEQPPTKSKSKATDDIDDKVMDFLAELETMDGGVAGEKASAPETGSRPSDEDEEDIPPPPVAPVCVWQQCQDQSSQFLYYWNTETDETTWEIPVEFSQYLLLMKEYEEALESYKKLLADRGIPSNHSHKKRKAKAPNTDSKQPIAAATTADDKKPSVKLEADSSKSGSKSAASNGEDHHHHSRSAKSKTSERTATVSTTSTSASGTGKIVASSSLASSLPAAPSTKVPAAAVAVAASGSLASIGRSGSALGSLFAAYGNDEADVSSSFNESPTKPLGSDSRKTSDGASSDDEVKIAGSTTPVYGPMLPAEVSIGVKGRDLEDDVDLDIETELDLALEKKAPPSQRHTDFVDKGIAFKAKALEATSSFDRDLADITGEQPIKRETNVAVATDRKRSSAIAELDSRVMDKRLKREEGFMDRPPIPDLDLPGQGDEVSVADSRIDIRARISQLEEVRDMAALVMDKLTALDITRQPLSKLQILLIETEVRIRDWREGGLSTDHLLRKLNDTHLVVEQCERSVAPPGWTCQWDRNHQRYYYLNDLHGNWQWEYPVTDVNQLAPPPPPPPPEYEDAALPPPPNQANDELQPTPPADELMDSITDEANASEIPVSAQGDMMLPLSTPSLSQGQDEDNMSTEVVADSSTIADEEALDEILSECTSQVGDNVISEPALLYAEPESSNNAQQAELLHGGDDGEGVASNELFPLADQSSVLSSVASDTDHAASKGTEKKKKKKSKELGGGLSLKKMPSMVQKWEQARKQLEEELQQRPSHSRAVDDSD